MPHSHRGKKQKKKSHWWKKCTTAGPKRGKPFPMEIRLSERLSLGPILHEDRQDYVTHLADKAIYDQTLRIPYPYALADADWWIDFAAAQEKQLGRRVNFSVRENNRLIGGCGFNDFELGAHKAEIGYWIARPWWGQGIMKLAVGAIVDLGFRELGLERITATIFENNHQSARVLEKSGFIFEGHLRNYYRKDGKTFHARLFAKFP